MLQRMSSGRRRLAAIMVTDMVGYSALVQTDEGRAMKLLETHRGLLRPIVKDFLGEEIKTLGDGFLIEFASALDATQCAIEIQRAHREHNQAGERDQFSVRIGVHIGDIIHQEGDVYGDAVNIASRIEPCAEPGGICISEQVYSQVGNKVSYPIVKIPPQRLRNIEMPFEIYRIVLPWDTAQTVKLEAGAAAVAPAAVRRIRSGIEGLDREIGGGLPEGTLTLVYGAPKAGKSVFAYHFLIESVSSNVPCVFIMTDYSAEHLSLAMSSFGWDIQEARRRGTLTLVDMTSTILGRNLPVSSGSLVAVSIASLTDLMGTLSTDLFTHLSTQGTGFRVVLDSLTPLFIYNPPMIVAKFLRQFALKLKGAGASGAVVTYIDGSVDPQSELIIKSSFDNLVHLHDRELAVEGMLGTPKVRMAYQITGAGMKVGF